MNRPRRVRPLTDRDVRELRLIGRHCEGNGLYLVIERSGGRRWILRTVIQGRRRDMGLGSVSLVSLAEARRLARPAMGAIPLPSAAIDAAPCQRLGAKGMD